MTKPKTPPTYAPQVEETYEGFIDTLTGFDEEAIAKHFDGLDMYLRGPRQTGSVGNMVRALVFVDLRRKGKTDPEAKQHVMGMPMAECNAYFVEDTDIDPDEPESPAGEDGSAVE